MAWDKTQPPTGSALQSAPIRANWDALDAALMAVLASAPAGAVLYVTGADVFAAAPGAAEGYVLRYVSGVPTWQTPPGHGVLPLPLEAARFPDGSAGNLFPQPVERISTGTPVGAVPKLVEMVYQFDAVGPEWLVWKGLVPPRYASTVTFVAKWSMVSAITGNVRLQVALACVVEDSTDARALITPAATVSADLAVPATLGQVKETRLTLTGLTNVAIGRKFLCAASLYAGGASSATGDRVLETAALEFA